MFPRVAQATFMGLLQWPDLMLFGLLSFVLSLGLNVLFDPFWANYGAQRSSGVDLAFVLGLLGMFAQQLILTVGSISIAVASARVVRARLTGGTLTVLQALRLRDAARPILTYSLLYSLIATVLSFAYLLLLFGESAFSFGQDLTMNGAAGLTQVPTASGAGSTGLLLVIFFPLLGAWTFANFLVPPVIAAEKAGGWRVIFRSGSLVRRTLSVAVGLIVTVFAFICVLTLLLSFIMAASMDSAALLQMSQSPALALPDLPLVIQAVLTALLFIIGSIFTTAWYLVAAEDEALAKPAGG